MEENSVFQKLVIRSIPNFFSLWIVSLTLGLMGCLLLSLLPYTPDIHRSPFFHGETRHVRQQLEMLAAHKADRVAKMRARAKLETQRKMFIRHAFERRKNVRYFTVFENYRKSLILQRERSELRVGPFGNSC